MKKDIPLPYYFHNFGVDNRLEAQIATGLISKYGLFSLSSKGGLGNISGDLSWSFCYGKESPWQLLTVWTNKKGLLQHSASGIAEYGITRKATRKQKGAITKEILDLLKEYPESKTLKELQQSLPFFTQLLPKDELSLALFLSSNDRVLFDRVWKEIEKGEGTGSFREIVNRHQQELANWFTTYDENVLLREEKSKPAVLAEGLTRALYFNNAVALAYELDLCLNPEIKMPDKLRAHNLTRAQKGLKWHEFFNEEDRELFQAHLQAIEERVSTIFDEIGLKTEGVGISRPSIE